MSSESGGVSKDGAEVALQQNRSGQMGALGGCLLEGDAAQRQRERKIRRRALVTSTLLQALVLLAVIAIPFFGKVERIALADWTPIPPYHPYHSGVREHVVSAVTPVGAQPTICFVCPQAHPTTHSASANSATTVDESALDGDAIGDTIGSACSVGCIDMVGRGEAPKAPQTQVTPAVVRVTHIDPAMLVERVEPSYPALARQTRRGGRVELHAIISADGRIESLEVVSGDVLFHQSALDAVRRWRYRPTVLNGTPVKVDTYITVIYVMEN